MQLLEQKAFFYELQEIGGKKNILHRHWIQILFMFQKRFFVTVVMFFVLQEQKNPKTKQKNSFFFKCAQQASAYG